MHVEEIWDALLSREPQRIKEAYRQLSPSEQAAVMAHLDKMVHESGWQNEQIISAQAALKVLTVADKHD